MKVLMLLLSLGAYRVAPDAEVRPLRGLDLADAQIVAGSTRYDGVCWRTPIWARDAGSAGPWTRIVLVKCDGHEGRAYFHYPR